MLKLCYLLCFILITAAAFLMWFFIYGRRDTLKDGMKQPGTAASLICSALLCFLTAVLITCDLRMALVILESYGEQRMLHLLFYPVSALILCAILIPCAVVSSGREAVVPGIPAISASFLFILMLHLLCMAVIHDHTYIPAALCRLVSGLLSCLAVYETPMLSKERYRTELKKIDSLLSDARHAHYEAVKKSSEETRRTRHDMKNHLIALRELAVQSRRDELLSYIGSLEAQIEAAAPPYRSGNDIADAIIADKCAKAEKRGQKLKITGNVAGLDMESADLVTVLSNLLDNAMEAVSRTYGSGLSGEDKTISLEFRKNSNFLLILEKNKSISELSGGRIVSVKNSPDHGFGIENIKRTVKKYGGEFSISCSESGALYDVEVEIVLPLKEG